MLVFSVLISFAKVPIRNSSDQNVFDVVNSNASMASIHLQGN